MMQVTWISLLIITLISCPLAMAQQVNYDEAKVPDYTLPDLFETANVGTVQSVNAWKFTRRPEIIDLFEKHVYGRVPDQFDSISFNNVAVDEKALGGTATARQIDITVRRESNALTMRLNLLVPNSEPGSSPVVLLINHRGPDNMDISREVKKDFWPAELLIERGYATAVLMLKILLMTMPTPTPATCWKPSTPPNLRTKTVCAPFRPGPGVPCAPWTTLSGIPMLITAAL